MLTLVELVISSHPHFLILGDIKVRVMKEKVFLQLWVFKKILMGKVKRRCFAHDLLIIFCSWLFNLSEHQWSCKYTNESRFWFFLQKIYHWTKWLLLQFKAIMFFWFCCCFSFSFNWSLLCITLAFVVFLLLKRY